MKRAFVSKDIILAGRGELDRDEAHHLCKSLRARPGDEVELLDGAGGRYAARIASVHKDTCVVEIVKKLPRFPPPPYKLTIGVSFPDKKRTSTMVRMLAELGVHRIFHLDCARSEWDLAAAGKQMDRLTQIAREACKQSGRARPMEIAPAKSFDAICHEIAFRTGITALVASTREKKMTVADRMADFPKKGSKILALIGPVGDLTDEEYVQTEEAGFLPVTLGAGILRVETAAVAVAARILG